MTLLDIDELDIDELDIDELELFVSSDAGKIIERMIVPNIIPKTVTRIIFQTLCFFISW